MENRKWPWGRKYILAPLLIIGSVLWIIFMFLVGWADRFILAFAPWCEVRSQTDWEYYDLYAWFSMGRVLGLAGIIFTIYLILKFIQ